MDLSTTKGPLALHALGKAATFEDSGLKNAIEMHLRMQLTVCRGELNVVTHLATCPSAFAVATSSGQIKVWSWSDGVGVLLAPQGPKEVEVSHTIGCMALSLDGKSVAIGDLGGSVAVPIGGGPLPFEGHHGSVESVVFKRDGKQLVSASIDKTVKVYCVITGRTLWSYTHPLPVITHTLCGELEHIVTASEDKKLRIWGGLQGGLSKTATFIETPAFNQNIHSMAADPLNSAVRVVCGLSDGSGVIWNFSEGAPSKIAAMLCCLGCRGAVSTVVFSPDSKFVAMVAEDKVVRVFDACRGGYEVRTVAFGFTNTFFRINWVGRLLCAFNGGDVLFWRITYGPRQPREMTIDHEGSISAVAISATRDLVAIAGENLLLKVYCYDDSAQHEKDRMSLYKVFDTASELDQLIFSPMGHHIVGAASWAGTLQGWKIVGSGTSCRLRGSLPEDFEKVIARLDSIPPYEEKMPLAFSSNSPAMEDGPGPLLSVLGSHLGTNLPPGIDEEGGTLSPIRALSGPHEITVAEQMVFMLRQVVEMERGLGMAPSPGANESRAETLSLQIMLATMQKENAALRGEIQSLTEEIAKTRQTSSRPQSRKVLKNFAEDYSIEVLKKELLKKRLNYDDAAMMAGYKFHPLRESQAEWIRTLSERDRKMQHEKEAQKKKAAAEALKKKREEAVLQRLKNEEAELAALLRKKKLKEEEEAIMREAIKEEEKKKAAAEEALKKREEAVRQRVKKAEDELIQKKKKEEEVTPSLQQDLTTLLIKAINQETRERVQNLIKNGELDALRPPSDHVEVIEEIDDDEEPDTSQPIEHELSTQEKNLQRSQANEATHKNLPLETALDCSNYLTDCSRAMRGIAPAGEGDVPDHARPSHYQPGRPYLFTPTAYPSAGEAPTNSWRRAIILPTDQIRDQMLSPIALFNHPVVALARYLLRETDPAQWELYALDVVIPNQEQINDFERATEKLIENDKVHPPVNLGINMRKISTLISFIGKDRRVPAYLLPPNSPHAVYAFYPAKDATDLEGIATKKFPIEGSPSGYTPLVVWPHHACRVLKAMKSDMEGTIKSEGIYALVLMMVVVKRVFVDLEEDVDKTRSRGETPEGFDTGGYDTHLSSLPATPDPSDLIAIVGPGQCIPMAILWMTEGKK